MSTLKDARDAIDEYQRRFRRDDANRLEVSDPYDLEADWRSKNSPNATRAGVYLFLDQAQQLLYVGKASWKRTLGGRLYNYFRTEADGGCRIRHEGWSSRPKYVLTVAVPEDMPFEAPALEEYLVAKLKPLDNTVGIRLCADPD
jgi:hypothetical protein